MKKKCIIVGISFLIMISVSLLGCDYIAGVKYPGYVKGTIKIVPGTEDETINYSTYVSDSPYQRIVDAVKTLQNTKTIIPRDVYYKEGEEFHFNTCIKGEGWFDINDYFSVLPHISMKYGYVLDYVYIAINS